MSDKSVEIVYDHYKETCSIISEAVRRRDRLMLFMVFAIGFFAFQAFFPAASNTAVNDFLNFKFGLTLKLNLSIVGSVIWFLLLMFTIRYFQVAVFIERQYSYIHQTEDALNKELGKELITREGKTYLNKYPLFSTWMWAMYTIIFPTLLLVVSIVKIVSELKFVCLTGWSAGLILNSIVFCLLAVSVVLYVIVIHKKKT